MSEVRIVRTTAMPRGGGGRPVEAFHLELPGGPTGLLLSRIELEALGRAAATILARPTTLVVAEAVAELAPRRAEPVGFAACPVCGVGPGERCDTTLHS